MRDRERQKNEEAGARKGRHVARRCVFPRVVAPENRKIGLLRLPNAAGAESAGQMKDEKVHAVVA